MSVPLAVFGPGILICTRTDISNGTPVNIGFAQEFTIEAAGTTKQLYGQNQFPLVAARATIKTTGKFKAATFSGIAMNNVFFGQTNSTASGQIAWTVGSTFSLSTAAATLQVGSSLTFDADLGVTYASTASVGLPGIPFRRVSTGSEALGQYSVASTQPGLYTFAATDTTGLTAGATNPIKVTFTSTTATGTSLLITNSLIGTSPTFQLDYYTNLNQPSAKPFVVRIYQNIAAKLTLPFKLEDFALPEYETDIFANSSGQIFNIVFPENS